VLPLSVPQAGFMLHGYIQACLRRRRRNIEDCESPGLGAIEGEEEEEEEEEGQGLSTMPNSSLPARAGLGMVCDRHACMAGDCWM
jgi:hypothetical protein